MSQFTGSAIWQLRMYAARAAANLKDRARLEKLAEDSDDNVSEAAIEGLVAVAGHDADAVYIRALSRGGYQAVRVAALALEGTSRADAATPALRAALDRLNTEGRENSVDVRTAITKTLTGLGAGPAAKQARIATVSQRPALTELINGEDLRRLAAPKARITIADVGVFDLALITSEAPLTVLRFADLAESGYYNGLTFHRVAPNFVIQGGSPAANEYVGIADHMRDELGLWPHVRGAVGISTRGRDTGDAQIFVDLADNPRLDHDYTVFAQVLNGIDVVEKILEGDVIERVEIIP
jgi:cyclophilin family peptidyl-prolyl cis-trans isomerase